MAAKSYENVYQFKITLQEISPPVWRRIQVPGNYTFWDLHVAIQDCMGWTDSHLHAFRIKTGTPGDFKEIGIPDDSEFGGSPTLAGWEENIAGWFSEENNMAGYNYDFGDDWNHEVILEKILPREAGLKYPICLDGERACPPEDCGGPYGYEDMLQIIADPGHEEYEETITWLGGKYDPDKFELKKVKFDNPARRLRALFAP